MKLLQLYRKSPNALLYALALLAFVLFFINTVWGDDGLLHLMDLHNQKNRIIADRHGLMMDNLRLINEIGKLKEARYLEQTARTEFGLVRENETVFLVSEE